MKVNLQTLNRQDRTDIKRGRDHRWKHLDRKQAGNEKERAEMGGDGEGRREGGGKQMRCGNGCSLRVNLPL